MKYILLTILVFTMTISSSFSYNKTYIPTVSDKITLSNIEAVIQQVYLKTPKKISNLSLNIDKIFPSLKEGTRNYYLVNNLRDIIDNLIQKDFEKFLNQGLEFYNLSHYKDAQEAFDKALVIKNDSYYLYYLIGNTYYMQGDYYNAIDNYDSSIEVNKTYSNAYQYKAASYYMLKQYDKSIEFYDIGLDIDSWKAWPYIWKWNIYYQTKNYDEAIFNYSKALTLDQFNIETHRYRGWSYFLSGNYENACPDAEIISEGLTEDTLLMTLKDIGYCN